MRKRIILATKLIAFICALLIPTDALANFYSFYKSTNSYYGIWADITSPSQRPFIPDYITSDYPSHSVTTTSPYTPVDSWIQTGWLLRQETKTPTQYYEFKAPGPNEPTIKQHLNNHNWGTTYTYMVMNEPITNYPNRWCAYIQNVQKVCSNINTAAPSLVAAQSETHDDPTVEFNVIFSNIMVKISSPTGPWTAVDVRGLVSSYFPYTYSTYQNPYNQFFTWRFGTYNRHVPLIMDSTNN